MFIKIKNFLTSKKAKQLVDPRNIGLYIFAIIVLAISWSGVKAVQTNYNLQKKISELQQQNNVISLQNENIDLQNKYLQTNEYLDLSARQNLGLAAPGEQVLIVPKSTAMKYVDSSLATSSSNSTNSATDHRSRFVKNLEAWRDFLLGRKPSNS